jgi:predicted negative regulator of RcsB-dependent stress response
MVRPSRRITRKDLRQPDQFVTLTRQFLSYFARHRQTFLISLSILCLGLLSLVTWDLYRARQKRRAAAEYARAVSLYHGGNYQQALESLTRLEIYRSSRYSRLGLLYSAKSHLALNEPAKAVSALQQFLRSESDPLLRQAALIFLGYAYEQTAKCEEAAAKFVEAEKIPGPLKEEAILGKARCYLQTGNLKEALNSYRQYISENPASDRIDEISLRLQELAAKIGEAAAPAAK